MTHVTMVGSCNKLHFIYINLYLPDLEYYNTLQTILT